MRTSAEELEDALVRHQINLLAYSSGVQRQIIELLAATEELLAGKIATKLGGRQGLTTPSDWQQVSAVVEALEVIRGKAWDEVTDYLITEMNGLATHEVEYMQSTVTGVLPVVLVTSLPDTKLLKSIVTSRPFEGRLLKEWAEDLRADDLRRVKSAVYTGMAAGENTDAIVRRIVGTGTLKNKDGTVQITKNQVQTVVRTAIQHVANNARDEFFAANADIVEEEYFVATLDSRTTPICRDNDGKRYKRGEGPKPPLHMGCRSLRIAGFSASFLGERPMVPTTEKMLLREYAEKANLGTVTKQADLPKGHKTKFNNFARKRKRELIGTVPSKTTYREFLARQSNEFQDEVLGVTKAKLFREGGLDLGKFVTREGHELTLKELAAKERDAFKKAGLDPDDYK